MVVLIDLACWRAISVTEATPLKQVDTFGEGSHAVKELPESSDARAKRRLMFRLSWLRSEQDTAIAERLIKITPVRRLDK